MNCVEVKEHLETFLDEQTDRDLSREIARHLNGCEPCRAEFAELDFVSSLLKKELPASPAKQLDVRVMAAFRQHHKQKATWNWSAIFALFFAPKPIYALLTLCFLTGLAFLIGRMTAPPREIIVSSPPQIVEKEVPREVLKYVEVPVTKTVGFPTEKIITRTVYRTLERKNGTYFANNLPKNISDSAVSTQFDLKDFQPLGEIAPRIVKKGETNEK
ncbi:MAG: hypothetical protein K1X72_23790 [Pyrinomonadaceae bacterium]|nr:hypothetical protein [Pyrinomonadaceae bacterium]